MTARAVASETVSGGGTLVGGAASAGSAARPTTGAIGTGGTARRTTPDTVVSPPPPQRRRARSADRPSAACDARTVPSGGRHDPRGQALHLSLPRRDDPDVGQSRRRFLSTYCMIPPLR